MATKVLFKFGTAAEYAALATKQSNALYFLLDTNELYRGEVPFGQAHVYTGLRQSGASDIQAITAILNGNKTIPGDIVVVRNTDDSSDAFVYSAEDSEWVHIGSTLTNSISTQVATLTGQVADLEAILNGVEADPEHDIEAQEGLLDRVADLETALANSAGAFHFKGSVADLDALEALAAPAVGDVYQVGSSEYAWNGSTWVELGTNVDLSAYATRQYVDGEVASLEALIGHAARDVEDPETGETTHEPATGIFADLANNPGDIIPIFNGLVNGLVPVASSELTTAQKAQRFLNALGQWQEVSTGGGQSTYTDPDGNTYNSVEDYVTHMLTTIEVENYWESIDGTNNNNNNGD